METDIEPAQVPDSGRANRLRVSAGTDSVQGVGRDTNEDAQDISPDRHPARTQEAITNGARDEVTCVVFYVQSDLSEKPPPASALTPWQRLRSWFRPTS